MFQEVQYILQVAFGDVLDLDLARGLHDRSLRVWPIDAITTHSQCNAYYKVIYGDTIDISIGP